MLEAAVRFGGLSSHDEAAEQIVRDRAPAPLLRRGRPLLAPYVDNGNAIAWDKEESIRFHHCLVDVLTERRFVLKDLFEADPRLDMVGVVFDGPRRRWTPAALALLGPSPRREPDHRDGGRVGGKCFESSWGTW